MGASNSKLRAVNTAPGLVSPEPLPPTTGAVLTGVRESERWAHAALFELLLPVVARTLQKVLRDSSGDYEDLVQVSFERIVRTIVERRVEVENLEAWAGAIAAHVALDAIRGRTRERRLFERDGVLTSHAERASAPNLERQLEARQRLEWLQRTLSAMNADQAQTVILHDVLGHGLAEIAVITGVTVAAAQRRLSRGHQELLRRAAKLQKGEA